MGVGRAARGRAGRAGIARGPAVRGPALRHWCVLYFQNSRFFEDLFLPGERGCSAEPRRPRHRQPPPPAPL
eukprot:4201709-Prymnesium_polylepis.1